MIKRLALRMLLKLGESQGAVFKWVKHRKTASLYSACERRILIDRSSPNRSVYSDRRESPNPTLALSEEVSASFYLYEFSEGRIHSRQNVIADRNGRPFFETINPTKNLVVEYIKSLLGHGVTDTDNHSFVFPLINPWSNGYFHWLLECLPSAVTFERYTRGIPRRLIIRRDAPGFVLRTLRLIGFEEDEISFNNGLCFRYGIFVDPARRQFGMIPSQQSIYSIEMIVNLREILVNGAHKPTRKIYISRDAAAKRRIINEEMLVERLVEIGFEVVTNEYLEFNDQVELYSRATVIVGAHGAGLANMIFCQTGAMVVEISGCYDNPCYAQLADQLNINYLLYKTGKNDRRGVARNCENIYVDVDAFVPWIQENVLPLCGAAQAEVE